MRNPFITGNTCTDLSVLGFLDIRRLVQSHRLTVAGDKSRPDYDGMAELWFDDLEALLAARQSAEWKASTEGEANFIDHNKVAYFVSEEHITCPILKLTGRRPYDAGLS